MMTVVASALIEVLAKYAFTQMLAKSNNVDINGAPTWYMKPVSNKMCVFTHEEGNYDSIDIAKINAKYKMAQKINTLIDISISENRKNITHVKEKNMVDIWSKDQYLDTFVSKNLDYTKLLFNNKINMAFAMSCIESSVIVDYQENRLNEIRKKISKSKMNNAINELETEILENE